MEKEEERSRGKGQELGDVKKCNLRNTKGFNLNLGIKAKIFDLTL